METTTFEKTPTTDAEYEAAVDQMLRQMEKIRASMAKSQNRSDKLRVQTRGKMAEFQKVLARLEAS